MDDWMTRLVAGWLPGDHYPPDAGALCWLSSKHQVARRLTPAFVAEIGVRAGYSAYALLAACPGARFLGIDRADPAYGDGDRFKAHAIKLLSAFPDVEMVRADSRAMECLPPRIDLLHIDGDHTYEGCVSDLDLALRSAVRWVLVDDVHHVATPGVAFAVADWVRARHTAVEYIHDGHRGSALIRLGGV